jgi:ribonuclease J
MFLNKNLRFNHEIKKNKTDLQTEGVRIASLGGFGSVTQNLFVYEYQKQILIIDCGVGFVEKKNQKTELIVPDFDYLLQNKDRIKGLVVTHGHEDHIAGLPFLLPKLDNNLPLYAPRLAAALIEEKLEEVGLNKKIKVIDSESRLEIGPFSLSFVYVTHSIPDTFHVIVKTPVGTIYHGSDFKFDWTPVMSRQSEVAKMALIGNQGVDLLLSDSLRSERAGYTLSEQMVEESFEREIKDCRGRFFVTTISSNVSRWQQAINVAAQHQRKVVLVGRSVEKVVEVAQKMGYLKIPKGIFISSKKAKFFRPEQLAFLISGAQAQVGSALEKVIHRQRNDIEIKPGDKVVFSTDYIPGNEVAIHSLIDKLSLMGADVSYSDISDDIHVSGHASRSDLSLLISLVRPKYLLPIGGAPRQMRQFALLAQRMGYPEEKILLPERNQTVLLLADGQIKLGPKISLHVKLAM